MEVIVKLKHENKIVKNVKRNSKPFLNMENQKLKSTKSFSAINFEISKITNTLIEIAGVLAIFFNLFILWIRFVLFKKFVMRRIQKYGLNNHKS